MQTVMIDLGDGLKIPCCAYKAGDAMHAKFFVHLNWTKRPAKLKDGQYLLTGLRDGPIFTNTVCVQVWGNGIAGGTSVAAQTLVDINTSGEMLKATYKRLFKQAESELGFSQKCRNMQVSHWCIGCYDNMHEELMTDTERKIVDADRVRTDAT